MHANAGCAASIQKNGAVVHGSCARLSCAGLRHIQRRQGRAALHERVQRSCCALASTSARPSTPAASLQALSRQVFQVCLPWHHTALEICSLMIELGSGFR